MTDVKEKQLGAGMNKKVQHFLQVNQKFYERFISMSIDEDKTNFDQSNHSQSSAKFNNICLQKKEHIKMEGIKEITYLKVNDNTKK